jgi:hypothetical protein
MSRQRKRTPARPVGSRDAKTRKPAPAARKRPAADNRRTAWIVGGVVAAVAVVGLIVATVSVGGDEGMQQTADVTITGTALPPFPESEGADPAVGMAMPELQGESFDGSPVAITADGRAKVILVLAHW